jgi:N-acetylneuraminic acid mutarotase
MSLKPLLWKNIEKSEKDDIWPRQVCGASLVYLDDVNKYFLIGGNFNAYENTIKNFQLNKDIISGIDRDINNFDKLDHAKLTYLTDNIYNNQNHKSIEIYVYEQLPEKKWYKVSSTGRVPKARSFQKCVYMKPYIFMFGGLEMGSKGENQSLNELYVLDTINFSWKLIMSKKFPFDRCDFQWIKLDKQALLYGGASSPSEIYHDDLWALKYDEYDFSLDTNKKECVKDYWFELTQDGVKPGKIRAYAMEFFDGYLYLYGGQDSKKKNKSDLFRMDITNCKWEIVKTKGKSPGERCYHEMSLINKDNLLVFGGIRGSMANIEVMYNDIFLYNINEMIWVEPVIGGIQPSPRLGFSFTCNYDFRKMEILILGGYSKSGNSSKYMKIFLITENEFESKHYWTIKDLNYQEEQNDEHFLIQSEQNIHEYKQKVDNLEIEVRNKELAVEDMRMKIEDFKKQIYKSQGFIDDQSQSLEEVINELETKKVKMEESLEYDTKITDLKMQLKVIMTRKAQKTMEFFCLNQQMFIKYYDSLVRMRDSKFFK